MFPLLMNYAQSSLALRITTGDPGGCHVTPSWGVTKTHEEIVAINQDDVAGVADEEHDKGGPKSLMWERKLGMMA